MPTDDFDVVIELLILPVIMPDATAVVCAIYHASEPDKGSFQCWHASDTITRL